MKIMIKKTVYDELMKSFGHKYKEKKLVNGKWVYTYTDGREEREMWHNHVATKEEFRSFIKQSLEDNKYQENILIDVLDSDVTSRIHASLGINVKKLTVSSDSVRHSDNLKHKASFEDLLLMRRVIRDKKTVMKYEGKTDKKKKDCYSFTRYIRGEIIFAMTMKNTKYGELELQSFYRSSEIRKSVVTEWLSPPSLTSETATRADFIILQTVKKSTPCAEELRKMLCNLEKGR